MHPLIKCSYSSSFHRLSFSFFTTCSISTCHYCSSTFLISTYCKHYFTLQQHHIHTKSTFFFLLSPFFYHLLRLLCFHLLKFSHSFPFFRSPLPATSIQFSTDVLSKSYTVPVYQLCYVSRSRLGLQLLLEVECVRGLPALLLRLHHAVCSHHLAAAGLRCVRGDTGFTGCDV